MAWPTLGSRTAKEQNRTYKFFVAAAKTALCDTVNGEGNAICRVRLSVRPLRAVVMTNIHANKSRSKASWFEKRSGNKRTNTTDFTTFLFNAVGMM